MVLLMALSLIPSFVLLGGFKYVAYFALRNTAQLDELSIDRDLTILGGCGALALFFGRLLFNWLERKNLCEGESLLRASLLLQYVVLLGAFLAKDREELRWPLTAAVCIATFFVHGSVVSLMPSLCQRVFGASSHFAP